MIKKFFTAIAFCVLCYTLTSAQGYRIEVQVDGVKDSTLFLAIYNGSGRFLRDTARTDELGRAVFSKDKPMVGGMYLLIAGKTYLCDFIISDDESQHFSVHYKVNEKENTAEVIYKNSPENTAFAEFQKYMGTRQMISRNLVERARKDTAFIAAATDSLKIIAAEEHQYIEEISEQWKGKFLGTITKAILPPPTMPEQNIPEDTPERDSILWVRNYIWEKDHYFHNIDLTDKRLLYTPFFQANFENYFARKIIQEPDSIISAIHPILNRAKASREMFTYCLGSLFNKYIQNKTVTVTSQHAIGTESVVIDLINNFYLAEGNNIVRDSVFLQQIRDYVRNNKNSLVGKKSPNLTMTQVNGKDISLYNIKADYTILIFFDTDCGHCKKEIPQIHDLYEQYKNKGVQVFCVYIKGNEPEWAKFVEDKKLTWTNVWDPYRKSKFTEYFDVSSTPQIFLLNKDKTIIARHASATFLEQVLGLYIDKKPITAPVESGVEEEN